LNLNQDCFTLFKEDRIIGNIFTTNYGNQAWISNVVVAKEARENRDCQGTDQGCHRVSPQKKNISTFRLGSVPLAIGLYKKVSFNAETFTTAQEADLPLKVEIEKMALGKNIQVEKIDVQNLEAIAKIDDQYFKSNRMEFFKNVYDYSIKESCLCLKDGEGLWDFS
jgi:hypothetical protein